MGSDTPASTAAELEREAACEPLDAARDASRIVPVTAQEGSALAMLIRRGFLPSLAPLDLPFPADIPERDAQRIEQALHRYAFRLFLRGAILRRGPFAPTETSRFLTPDAAEQAAQTLVSIGLAAVRSDGMLELTHTARSFGGTLEWYVARGLRSELGLDACAGVKFHAPGVGGDLDVIAAADGVLVCMELKSSPPKHLKDDEVSAFVQRVRALRPHIAIFAVDTALRISDKVVPLLTDAMRDGPFAATPPRRVMREVWALTPHVFAVNARPDLLANIRIAIGEGMRALGPPSP